MHWRGQYSVQQVRNGRADSMQLNPLKRSIAATHVEIDTLLYVSMRNMQWAYIELCNHHLGRHRDDLVHSEVRRNAIIYRLSVLERPTLFIIHSFIHSTRFVRRLPISYFQWALSSLEYAFALRWSRSVHSITVLYGQCRPRITACITVFIVIDIKLLYCMAADNLNWSSILSLGP